MRFVSLAMAAFAAAALSGDAVSAPVVTDPKALVLQPRDLPTGFARTSGRYVSNAQVNREGAVKRDFAKLGRLRGYEAIFQKQASKGIILVTSRAATYKTAAGARESMTITVRSAEATRQFRFRRLRVAKIGDETRLYTLTVTEEGMKVDQFFLIWRSERVLSAVIHSAPAGTADPASVVALARKQQARIAAG